MPTVKAPFAFAVAMGAEVAEDECTTVLEDIADIEITTRTKMTLRAEGGSHATNELTTCALRVCET